MGANILVVDDEREVRELLAVRLSKQGYRLTFASDGREALDALSRTDFDVVLTDIYMPGLDGLELLRRTKEVAPETEVVVATAYGELGNAADCVRGGACDYIQKPFNTPRLLAALNRAVERRRKRSGSNLHGCCAALLEPTEPQALAQLIVEVAMEALEADDASLMLSGANGRLYVACSSELAPFTAAGPATATDTEAAERIAHHSQPVFLSGQTASTCGEHTRTGRARVGSTLALPLRVGDRTLGVLLARRFSQPRPFRRSDVVRAQFVASQVVLALENGRQVRERMGQARLATLGQLAAGVVHEINNPVAAVLANQTYVQRNLRELRAQLEPAVDKANFDELEQAVGDIGDDAGRIRDIVCDMKALAHAGDAGARAIFDVNEAVRSAVRLASTEIKNHAHVDSRLGAGLMVRGSVARLSQVLINLLVNSAQALRETGRRGLVRVSSEKLCGRVVVCVRDDGPGIKPEHLPRLFETFFTTKPAGVGTGLGLSISRDIMRSMGGELRVESGEGRGACFTLDLPSAE